MNKELRTRKTAEINEELKFIREFGAQGSGKVLYNGKTINAEIEKVDSGFMFCIGDIIDFNIDRIEFEFISGNHHLFIEAPIVSHSSSIQVKEKLMSRISEGKVSSFRSSKFDKEQISYFRTYLYLGNDRLIYDYFGFKSFMVVAINQVNFLVHLKEKYVVIESTERVDYKVFSESSYSILVAIGFISGNFIQDESYTFQRNTEEKVVPAFLYRELRSGTYSMYHALTHNPNSYKSFIGKEYANTLYERGTLKPCDKISFSKLAELVENNSQIQYALVLFNEANNRNLSLLIKNNCFYAVLEVLKKFFYERFKDKLPKEYSQKGNIEKYKIIFGNVVSLTDAECKMVESRNVFLHGDIKDMKGKEMIDVMYKQISLIHRLLFSYIGFDGYIIDHYALRNNMPEQAFVKLN